MVDRPLNEQHEWGGHRFSAIPHTDTGGQTALPSRPATDTNPSQVPFVASHSDDLFAPATGSHSRNLPYILPTVPDFYRPRQNEQITPMITYPFPHNNNRSLPNAPLPFPLSSYNRTPEPYPRPLPRVYPQPDMRPPPPVPPYIPQHHFPQLYLPFSSVPSSQSHVPGQLNPQIQYVYVPAPSSDTSFLAPASKSLPVITSIHSLNSKTDFYAWDEGVCTLLRLLGIHGHIVDPHLPVDILRLDLSPALPPVLSQPPSSAEIKALTRWQDNDNIAQYVIVGRLGGLARQLLPSAYMGTRTAYTMYTTLTRYFGL